MMILAVRIEHPFPMSVQRFMIPVRPAQIGDQDQGFHGGLPFRCRMNGLPQLGDVVARIVQRVQRPSVRQRDGFIEVTGPAAVANGW